MNIVIVEDDINMRKSLEIALGEYEELNIKSYKSAVEALKKLSDDTDLIITDINIEIRNGIICFETDMTGRLPIPAETNSVIPTGGVTSPIQKVVTITTPK